MVKSSRIVRIGEARIKVEFDSEQGRATKPEVHSLLAHDSGAVIRQHCPMEGGYWSKLSEDKNKRPYIGNDYYHAGSRPLGYLVDKTIDFPSINAYGLTYGGKSINITNLKAKANYDDMVARRDEYVNSLTEKNLEENPLKDLIDENVEIEIIRSVLASKGQDFRGVGCGQLSKLKKGSLRERRLEEQCDARDFCCILCSCV